MTCKAWAVALVFLAGCASNIPPPKTLADSAFFHASKSSIVRLKEVRPLTQEDPEDARWLVVKQQLASGSGTKAGFYFDIMAPVLGRDVEGMPAWHWGRRCRSKLVVGETLLLAESVADGGFVLAAATHTPDDSRQRLGLWDLGSDCEGHFPAAVEDSLLLELPAAFVAPDGVALGYRIETERLWAVDKPRWLWTRDGDGDRLAMLLGRRWRRLQRQRPEENGGDSGKSGDLGPNGWRWQEGKRSDLSPAPVSLRVGLPAPGAMPWTAMTQRHGNDWWKAHARTYQEEGHAGIDAMVGFAPHWWPLDNADTQGLNLYVLRGLGWVFEGQSEVPIALVRSVLAECQYLEGGEDPRPVGGLLPHGNRINKVASNPTDPRLELLGSTAQQVHRGQRQQGAKSVWVLGDGIRRWRLGIAAPGPGEHYMPKCLQGLEAFGWYRNGAQQ